MKNKILPVITAIIVFVAMFIVMLIPKNAGNIFDTLVSGDNQSMEKLEARLNQDGNIEIKEEDLKTSAATFINYTPTNGYIVELIAVKDSSNDIDVAFNTCQVCNGAPKAYFILKNGKLVCQNCGNVFTLSSVGQEAYGCNPMTLGDDDVTKAETGIIISKDFLEQNENLFINVAKH